VTLGAVAIAAGEIAGPEATTPPAIGHMPVITTLVAFTSDPGATPVWTDISDRRLRFTVNRGRQRELDRFVAGRLTLTLNNEDRAFDPTYTSSPYYPNVIPMRRLKIQATTGGVTYDIFTGYVDSWNQEYQHPQSATCVVEATDAFKILNGTELLSSASAETVQASGPTLWWRLGDPSGSTQAAESVTGNYPLKAVGTPTFGSTSLNVNDSDPAVVFDQQADGLQGVFSEGTYPFTTAGSVELIHRTDETIQPQGPVWGFIALASSPFGIQSDVGASGVWVIMANNAGSSFTARVNAVYTTGATHHIAITWAAGSTIRIYIDGVDRTETTSTFTGSLASTSKWIAFLNAVNYPPYISGGYLGSTDEVAVWTRQLSATEVAAHYAAWQNAWSGDRSGARVGRVLDAGDWSATDRNIDTGASTVLSATLGGSVLSYLQKIEQTEQGALFVDAAGRVRFIARDALLKDPYLTPQATFGDSDPELEYADLSYVYDDQLIFNEVQVSRDGGITQVVGDATSQARYLRRTQVFDDMLYTEDATARGFAQWFVNHYKDPLLRATGMRLEPTAGNEATHFPQVLGRDLMDRVTVRRRPQNLGPAIDQPALIEGITHEVTAMEWRTTWNLSPAETQHYWLAEVAGYGEAGVTTVAGF